jgi:hypothetical protein
VLVGWLKLTRKWFEDMGAVWILKRKAGKAVYGLVVHLEMCMPLSSTRIIRNVHILEKLKSSELLQDSPESRKITNQDVLCTTFSCFLFRKPFFTRKKLVLK